VINVDKNVTSVAVFGVLCVLAGVIVGAGIAEKADLPWPPGPHRMHFAERAEFFMGYGPKGPGGKRGDILLELLSDRLVLNTEQRMKVDVILEKTRQEIDSVGKDVRASIERIREKGDEQIMSILTPQQQEKFKALQEEFKKMHGIKSLPGEHGLMREHMPPPNKVFPPPLEEYQD
jgi:hypothetical protein